MRFHPGCEARWQHRLTANPQEKGNSITPKMVVAVSALALSVLTAVPTIVSHFADRRNMRLSVKPVATFPMSDYENRVEVRLRTKGLSPMRISKLKVSPGPKENGGSVIDFMPELVGDTLWSTFYGSADGAYVESGKSLILVSLKGDEGDAERYNDEVREAFAPFMGDDRVRSYFEMFSAAVDWAGVAFYVERNP